VYFPCPVNLDFRHDSTVDGAREDIASVVVRVFADEIDTAGRSENFPFGAEESLELLSDLGFHIHNHVIFNCCQSF
jgi:hypothetical protein